MEDSEPSRRISTQFTVNPTVLFCVTAKAQVPLAGVGTRVQLNGSDLAVLEAQEVRKEITCTVTPDKPALGFDLRYHAGCRAPSESCTQRGASYER